MKRVLGIILLAAILICVGFIVYLDMSDQGAMELVHYIAHIFICVMFCTLFHNPAHKFYNWMKGLLGFKIDDHD